MVDFSSILRGILHLSTTDISHLFSVSYTSLKLGQEPDFLEAGARALGGSKAHKADETLQRENDQLKKLLGEKTLELDILKKGSSL